MKRIIVAVLFVLLFALASSQPTLLIDQAQPEQWPCEEFKVIEKTFNAKSEDISIGLWCPENSRISLFECPNNCQYLTQGYKNQGNLPKFTNFEIGEKYNYQCHTCENTCALTATERETVNLNKFFQGVKFRLTKEKAGFNQQGIWISSKGDAGEYNIKVELYNNQEWEEVQFCVAIKEANDPPKLTVQKQVQIKEGEILTLNAECVDPEGQETITTYEGFTNTVRKRISFEDSGTHKVKVICSDNTNVVEEEIIVKVINVNRAPIIEQIWE
jgi:hypothetical protein